MGLVQQAAMIPIVTHQVGEVDHSEGGLERNCIQKPVSNQKTSWVSLGDLRCRFKQMVGG